MSLGAADHSPAIGAPRTLQGTSDTPLSKKPDSICTKGDQPFSLDGQPLLPEASDPEAKDEEAVQKFRSIWISDIHLGTRACKAEMLLDFLRETRSERLYLVGDIIDGWRLKRSWFWPQAHNDVVQKILRKARHGTQVIYIPGNHDEGLREFTDHQFGGVAVVDEHVHEMANGKQYMVFHGDAFDAVVKYARWLALLGDQAYQLALHLNEAVNFFRRRLGYPYWSLSAFLKYKVKNAVEFISQYEQAVAHACRDRGLDGVICGHIHHAEIREIDGVHYCNDGDWVESCTALVEHFDGRLEIIRWSDRYRDRHLTSEQENQKMLSKPKELA